MLTSVPLFCPPVIFCLQTGQPMGQLSLVPNLNLGRLIKDLLNEGGEGLYLHRVSGDDAIPQCVEQGRGRARGRDGSGDYRFALVTEQILVLKVCIMSGYRTII